MNSNVFDRKCFSLKIWIPSSLLIKLLIFNFNNSNYYFSIKKQSSKKFGAKPLYA